jgi:hypothetical protein
MKILAADGVGEMLERLKKHSKILVSGAQRSGTRISAKIIARECNLRYVDEKFLKYGWPGKDSVSEICEKEDNFVLHCPSASKWLHEFKDVAVVYITRNFEDVIKSQKKINWTGEKELINYGLQPGQQAMIPSEKYKFWRENLPEINYEIPYESFQGHPMWLDARENFLWHQTQENKDEKTQVSNPKHIKLFIVTHRGKDVLHTLLDSVFQSDITKYDFWIYIINNHSEFEIHKKFSYENITILHNNMRPDWSAGFSSRCWNQSIIYGFNSLLKPSSKIVCHVQDDSEFLPNWASNIIKFHKEYSFITFGHGDQFCSYTPESVKKIGMWDERFCSLGYHEGDYFYRAVSHNANESSINDAFHGRYWNECPNKVLKETITGIKANRPGRVESGKYCDTSKSLFFEKWGCKPYPWPSPVCPNEFRKTSLISNFVYYPFFEKDVYDLNGKNYFTAPSLTKKPIML